MQYINSLLCFQWKMLSTWSWAVRHRLLATSWLTHLAQVLSLTLSSSNTFATCDPSWCQNKSKPIRVNVFNWSHQTSVVLLSLTRLSLSAQTVSGPQSRSQSRTQESGWGTGWVSHRWGQMVTDNIYSSTLRFWDTHSLLKFFPATLNFSIYLRTQVILTFNLQENIT